MAEARSHKAEQARSTHTGERDRMTTLTMTTSRAAVEGRALLSDMLRCATLSMLALASQASRRHVSPPLGAPPNHSRRATRTPRRAWDVDALKQSFNWAASYPSTDTQYSAHTAAQVVLNRAATQRAALLGVTDTGTGPRCQGLPGTAEAGLRTDVEADMYRCGSQRRCCERR